MAQEKISVDIYNIYFLLILITWFVYFFMVILEKIWKELGFPNVNHPLLVFKEQLSSLFLLKQRQIYLAGFIYFPGTNICVQFQN